MRTPIRLSIPALALCLGLALSAGDARAGFETGRSLIDHCTSTQIAQKIHCLGYIMGVYDALDTAGLFCAPKDITAGRLRDLVQAYLQENPERWDFDAENVVIIALGKAYPCK